VQPLAIDLDELTARRHRGFDLPRGVGGKQDQTRNDQGNDQNQRQQNAHVRRSNDNSGTYQYDTGRGCSSAKMDSPAA
jgi:hypothetical protein